MLSTGINRMPERYFEPERAEESKLLDPRLRLGHCLSPVDFQQTFLRKSDRASVLTDEIRVKYAPGEFVELFRLDCTQVAGADLCSVGDCFEGDAGFPAEPFQLEYAAD